MAKTWTKRVKEVYCDLDDLRHYDEIFGVVGRLGFKSAESLWKANPMIGGSVRPEDFGVVHA